MDQFELNDDFLAEVGLSELSTEFRAPFLRHVYDTLELRAGERLSGDLDDRQLAEFEAIVEHRMEVIDDWIAQNAPEYANDFIYKKLEESSSSTDQGGLRAEYAATKWLALNQPEYRSIVRSVLEELGEEIRRNHEEILGATTEDSPVPPNQSPPPLTTDATAVSDEHPKGALRGSSGSELAP